MSTKTLEGTLPVGSAFKKEDTIIEQPVNGYRARIIYCYTTDYHEHVGKVKVGDTTAFVDANSSNDLRAVAYKAAEKRIGQQSKTIAVKVDILWAVVAPSFELRDHKIHAILQNNNISKSSFDYSAGQEWFDATADEAYAAYEAAIAGVSTMNVDYENYQITLRNEQEMFVKNTLEAWLNGEKHRLWNAKMRFGKTPTAYSFIEASLSSVRPIRKVLVITHRPVVNAGWAEDADKLLKKHNFQYSSKSSEHLNFADVDKTKPFIHFVSTQDMRGKDKTAEGFKASNAEVFATEWDLIIIDEAHEGNDTELAVEVHENLSRKFTLYLSGTPFKILSDGRFTTDEVDTWDYIDEQAAKESWDDSKGVNPWGGLAKMWVNIVEMREIVKKQYANDNDEDAAFDFNAMFATIDNTDIFEHEDDVSLFLDVISGTVLTKSGMDKVDKSYMPFSKERRDFIRHSLAVLPSVAACNAFEKLLNKHSFFKDYEVVNVAGSEGKDTKKPLKAVRQAIGSNPTETKTITLTVGRLTTGVTVPEWNGVLMLRNTTSASFYMQTIFRVQSPHEFNGMTKTDAFVWDFAPDRVLKVLTEVSGVNVKAGANRDQQTIVKLGELLNYMGVISHINNNDMRVTDAEYIVRELNRVTGERVRAQGFDSNFLFVKDFSGLTDDIRDALQNVYNISKGSMPKISQKINGNVVIASNDFSDTNYEVLSKEVKALETRKSELTSVEKEQLRLRKEELTQRENMCAILKTISVRLPVMIIALMGDKDFRDNKLQAGFSFEEFVNKFDNASWNEFFGSISKEMFIRLEPAFDKAILQIAVTGFITELEAAFVLRDTGKIVEYEERIETIWGRIKNPNKETVFTPYETVCIHYITSGFTGVEAWKELVSTNKAPTFFDINTKSGVYPFYAAARLSEVNKNKTWSQVCDESIFANARTLAGKWVTCALLGKPRDWVNITVIDVIEELEKEEIQGLSDDAKTVYAGLVLADNMNTIKSETYMSLSDIENKEEVIGELQKYDKLVKEVIKDKDMSDEAKVEKLEAAKAELKDLSFDHVISNPPYQLNTDDHGGAKPIWQYFLTAASEVGKHIAIINPARWQKGGQGTGLLGVKTWLMGNPHFEKVINMPANEIFPTASISGDISIEIIDNTRTFKNPKIGTWDKTNNWSEFKDFILDEIIDISIDDKDSSIVRKIIESDIYSNFEKQLWIGGQDQKTIKPSSVSVNDPRADFGIMKPRLYRDIDYFVTKQEKQDDISYVKIYYGEKGSGNLSERYLPVSEMQNTAKNNERLPKWKAMVPASNAHFIYRNLGPLGEPNSLCTPTWLCRSFDSEIEAIGFNSYIKTYLYRYLISIRKTSHIALANIHRFVPDLVSIKNPRTGKVGYNSDWTDDDLVELFKDVLTMNDWKHIKATAVAADKGKGDYEAGWVFPDGSTRHSLTLPEEDN